jgi:hypothetical protein
MIFGGCFTPFFTFWSKFGYEWVEALVPEEQRKLLVNIKYDIWGLFYPLFYLF